MDGRTDRAANFTSISLPDAVICLKAAALGGAGSCVSMAVFRKIKSIFKQVCLCTIAIYRRFLKRV